MKKAFNVKKQFELYKDIPSILKLGEEKEENYVISVIMPVYKHPDFFRLALKSVIEQDFDQPYEIIVVDDDMDSTNNYEVAKEANSSKVKYYKNSKNLGLTGNWNRCIELAKGTYIVFCHDDERFENNALSMLYQLSKKTDGYSAIFPNKNSQFEDGSITNYPVNKKLWGIVKPKELQKGTFLYFVNGTMGNGCGALLRRECIVELGGYDPQYYPCSDYAIDVLYTHYWGSYRAKQAWVTSRQGENLSLECYQLFAKQIKQICEQAIPFSNLPHAFSKYLIYCKFKKNEVSFAIGFGGASRKLLYQMNPIHLLFSKILSYYVTIKKYL